MSLHSVMQIFIGLSQLKESESLVDDIKQLIYGTELFKNENSINFRNTDVQSNSLTEIKSHALNILRTLVKNTQLGDMVQNYIADCLISAVRCYDGNCWAVS